MMDPRTAEIDGRPGQVDGVQPSSDAVAGFEDNALDTRMLQRRGDGETRDAGTDHDHALDGTDKATGDIRARVIEHQQRHRACPGANRAIQSSSDGHFAAQSADTIS